MRDFAWRGRLCACVASALFGGASLALGQPAAPQQYGDGPPDARPLRFDGGPAPSDMSSPLPDLVNLRIGGWTPNDTQDTLFRGAWAAAPADFFRLDLVFAGVVNPPGLGFPSNIFFFGDNPLLGFVEFDVDADPASGGELLGAQFRYQGAAARFGGLPQGPRFTGRMARDTCPGTFDGDISTGPYFPERSGEEFHLAFLWGAVTSLDVGSNGDFEFEVGETWLVRGEFLNRAFGFNDFALVCCSNGLPTYRPQVELLWSHALLTDRTTVSLVYPLTQAGAAAVAGEAVEPLDCCASNQNSVEEALWHVSLSAELATAADRADVNFPLIAPWEFTDPVEHLDPLQWELNAIFAGAFVVPDATEPVLAWTDAAPNARPGDFNGDGLITAADLSFFDDSLAAADGGPCDADGIADGTFTIIDFGNNFNMFDANYDGVVDAADRPSPTGTFVGFDSDGDGDVDLADYAVLKRCPDTGSGLFSAACEALDVNQDGVIDEVDLGAFVQVMTGPLGGS
jgi:hypothetical protein